MPPVRAGTGSHPRAHKKHNRAVKHHVAKKTRPFVHRNVLRPCEGRKVGALDSNYIAAQFSKGHDLIQNGDFEQDDDIRGVPDNWHFTNSDHNTGIVQTQLSSNKNSGDTRIGLDSVQYMYPGDPIIFESVEVMTPPPGYTGPINAGMVAAWRHKRREWAWIEYPFAGRNSSTLNKANVYLADGLKYNHTIDSYVNKMLCCIDDRSAISNPLTLQGPYSGDKSVRLDVASAHDTSTLTSDWFEVHPGEAYYISLACVAGQAMDPGAGLNFQIQWRGHDVTVGVGQHGANTITLGACNLVSPPYNVSVGNWELIECIAQAPKMSPDASDAFNVGGQIIDAHSARLIIQNVKSINNPIWIDDVRAVNSKLHRMHHGFFNPGALQTYNSAFVHKYGDTYILPVSEYPDGTAIGSQFSAFGGGHKGTGGLNCDVYVEDNFRDISSAIHIDAHMHVSHSDCSVAMTYSHTGRSALTVQPDEFYMLRVEGSTSKDSHGASNNYVSLWHCIYTGTWQWSLIGAKALGGGNQYSYHGFRLIHDPSDSTYGGAFGSITAWALGVPFAASACTFATGVGGIMGGDGGYGKSKAAGVNAAGYVKDYNVSTQYSPVGTLFSEAYNFSASNVPSNTGTATWVSASHTFEGLSNNTAVGIYQIKVDTADEENAGNFPEPWYSINSSIGACTINVNSTDYTGVKYNINPPNANIIFSQDGKFAIYIRNITTSPGQAVIKFDWAGVGYPGADKSGQYNAFQVNVRQTACLITA